MAFKSVAGIFPPINMVLGGTIQVQYYTRPVSLGIFSKNSSGDEVRTLTICKSGTNYRYIDVNIRLVPVSGNFWEGHAKFCGGKAIGPFSYTSNLNGKIENIRTVTYKGEDYIAVDFTIRQFGNCAVYITGMHPDITEMIDVTGQI